jgi:phage shock protein PspC (stress-responsive transcriptional regulator)/Na+-transporting methylmalonyl-CoA/oxaloacetate decarboxylase gamma subunit
MTSPPLTDPGPPPPSPAPPVSRSDRFFSWTAGLGVVRADGWIGGVGAGLSARLGIDPLIIRGILVVIALFGFPALFLYALAWALLPDLDGRIVAQEALRGRFTPALVGVGVFALAGLLPAPLALFVGLPTFSVWNGAGALLSLAATLIVLGVAAVAGLLVFLIVRSARNASTPAPAAATAPADVVTAEPHGSELADDDAPDSEAVAAVSPTDPEDEMAAWRAQHAAWREQDQLWRQQQQDAARAAREQARRERQAAATAFAAEAAERRRHRRAVNPRAPFAYVAAAVGAGVILGTTLALQQSDALAPALGLFVAGAVLAAAMVLAGILRRRSGFLAFVTAMSLLAGLGALAAPAANSLHLASYRISNTGEPRFSADVPFVQPWGDLTVTLADTGRAGQTHIEKRAGSTFVDVMPGVEVTLEVTTDVAAVEWMGSETPLSWQPIVDLPGATTETLSDGTTRYTATLANLADGEDPTTTERMVIDQDAGYVAFYLQAPAPEEDQP